MHRLERKKLIIYGDERYVRDFRYVFESLNINYVIDDQENEFSQNRDKIKEEKKEDIFVIICKYEESMAIQYLEKQGLKKNIHFASATSFFPYLDFPLHIISEEKNVYVWGTGDRSHNFFHEFIEKHPEIHIAGCIDSDMNKAGKTWFRRPIYTKEQVGTLKNAFFIIATTDYYDEIREELKSIGKIENVDFVHYSAIHQRASWMMRETVYDIPRLDYMCPKPFCDVEIFETGRISACVGIPGNPDWTVSTYYSNFYDIWHSNVMKVLRLSVINGTYTFCSRNKCNILEKCVNQEIDTDELHYELHYGAEKINQIEEKPRYSRNTVFCAANYNQKENEYPDTVMCGYDKTCNLHCPSCRKEIYGVKGKEKDRLMAYTERMKKELFEKVDYIKLSGSGEVFASESCKSILYDNRLSKRIRKIGILSNGTLFDRDRADQLTELYEEVRVFISMDGARLETAEKLRAGANFKRWKTNMEYLGDLRKRGKLKFLAFNFVVQRDNYKEMPEFVRMCLGFHADGIKFSKIFNWGGYSEEEFQSVSMFNYNGEMLEELKEVVKDPIFLRPEVYLFSWIDW